MGGYDAKYYKQYGKHSHMSNYSTSLSDRPSPNKFQKQQQEFDDQLQERRKRQLMIMNGIRDPEAIEEMMTQVGETVVAGQTELVGAQGKPQQKNLNYVYSSDEYVSGTDSEIEQEEQDEDQDGGDGAADGASILGKSFQNNATCSNFDSSVTINNNNNSKTQTIATGKTSADDDSAKWNGKNVLDQPLDIESQKTLEQKWFGDRKLKEATDDSLSRNNAYHLQSLSSLYNSQGVNNRTSDQQQRNSFGGQMQSQTERFYQQQSNLQMTKQTSQDTQQKQLQQQQQQSNNTNNIKPSNYKTVLCKWWEEYGKCTYVGCTFAHGQKDLNFNRRQYPPTAGGGTAGNTPNQQQNQKNNNTSIYYKYSSQQQQQPYYEGDEAATGEYGGEYDDEEYYGEQDYSYDYYAEMRKKHPKYKTEMCRNIEQYGECNYQNCTFAHTRDELRKLPSKLPSNLNNGVGGRMVLGLPYEADIEL